MCSKNQFPVKFCYLYLPSNLKFNHLEKKIFQISEQARTDELDQGEDIILGKNLFVFRLCTFWMLLRGVRNYSKWLVTP